MDQEKWRIFIATQANSQSQLFVDYLQQQLNHTISLLPPEAIWKVDSETPTLVLLDFDHLNDQVMETWQTRKAEQTHITLAALNLRDDDHAMEILPTLQLQGIFYRSDTLQLVCKGVNALLSGQLWLSRSVTSRMIDFFRQQQQNAYRPACGLTKREYEIISMLGSGASNQDIARRLFVSEHTVKSHLYNIFRKIGAHNRIQAVNWARQNLAMPPLVTPTKPQERSLEKRQDFHEPRNQRSWQR